MDEPPWPDGYELAVERDGGAFSFLTRDGVVSKTELRPEERALLDAIDPGDRSVLVPDANYGVVGTVLARADGASVTMTETSARSATCCRVNADRNDVADAVAVEVVPWEPTADREHDVLAYAPKAYAPTDVNRQRLLRGLGTVAPGGSCYVAASESDDLDRYRETLEAHCSDVTRVATDDERAVLRATRPPRFEPMDVVAEREFRASVGDYTCRFVTQPGLFSWEGLDAGTAALLEAATVDDGSRVLDLACGYGAVGAFVGARSDCELYATDDDVVATSFAERNYRRNGVSPAAVETGDCLDAVQEQTFDVILSNPPTHAGKGVTTKLFHGVADALRPGGEFWLVYNEIMEYDRQLRSEFEFDVEVVASADSYLIARARR